VAALAVALPAAAQDSAVTFTGSATVVTDYAFRGISQSFEDPAVQAGITGAGGPVYLGVWGSSVDFGETAAAGRATAEVDIFGGLKLPLGFADADLGFTYYAYPGTGDAWDYNFLEFALGLSKAISSATLGAKVSFSPDYFAASGTGLYMMGSLGVGLPNTPLSLAATLGKQTIETNSAFGTPDYMDYSVGASLAVLGISVGAAVVGTDIDESDCIGGTDLCKTRVVVSVSRGM
jgi:uncharacterized protein (TIGR02001 family)